MFLEKVAEVFGLEANSEKLILLGYAFRDHFGNMVVEDEIDKVYAKLDFSYKGVLGKFLWFLTSSCDFQDDFDLRNDNVIEFLSELLELSKEDFKSKARYLIKILEKEYDFHFEDDAYCL